MKLSRGFILLTALAAAAVAAAVVLYLQSRRPDCDCFFPNEGRYGVYREGGGCALVDCKPPEKRRQ